MKYVQPYGIADQDASYINGDPSIGRMGSIPPAEAFEHPMREIANVITKSMITPDSADLMQMAKGIRSQRMNFAEDTDGSPNTIQCVFDPPITSYTIGLMIRVRVLTSNTGATSINAGAGWAQIKKPNGAQVAANDIPAGGILDLVYDGAVFQIVNFVGYAIPVGPPEFHPVNIPYGTDIGTANNIVVTFQDDIGVPAAGSIVLVRVMNTNTGPTTANFNGHGAHPVNAIGGTALIHSDVQPNQVYFMRYDGTVWWIDPSPTITQNVAFTVYTNAQLDQLFIDLSRKRLQSNVYCTITLAQGVYSRITTYHVDADRIRLTGVMLGAVPTKYDFAKTGFTAAARDNDAAQNLYMLRTRYGTEVRFTQQDQYGIQHVGPGRITISNILVTNERNPTPAGLAPASCVCVAAGGSMYCAYVSVWGGNTYGFSAISSSIDFTQCYSVAACYAGFATAMGGAMILYSAGSAPTGCGAFGGGYGGIAFGGAALSLFDNNEFSFNASFGMHAFGLGSGSLTASGNACVNNQYWDLAATQMGMIGIQPGNTYGPTSPALNTVGNSNSIISG